MEDFLVAIIVGWILFRLFRPVVLVHWNKPQQHHNYSSPDYNQTQETELKVNKMSTGKKNIPDDAGEYVDFEEFPKL